MESACSGLKICQVTSAHSPYDTRILYKFSMSLRDAGYEVVVIAPHEQSETIGRIRVRAVAGFKNRLDRLLRVGWRVYRAAMAEQADLYHFHDPELIGVGLLLKLRGKRVLYDVHEDLPQQMLNKYWVPAILRNFLGRAAGCVEALGAHFFNGITAATPLIARRFPGHKTAVVQNFPLSGELIPMNDAPYNRRERLAVYVGNIADVRGAKEMVEATALINEKDEARLLLVGNFVPPEYETELIKTAGRERVCFLGWQDRGGVRKALTAARVGLVPLHPLPNYLESYPIKLFEYMSAGLPVIASDFTLWRSIIEEVGCGLLVDPLSPEAIAGALRRGLDNPVEAEQMGRCGREAVLRRYNWERESGKMLALYSRVLGKEDSSPC